MCNIFTRSPRSLVRRFAADEKGNIAIIFAIVLVPLLSFVGAAVDYSRANNARTAMQAAGDSAALMVSKDLATGAITSDQITAKANAYFKALYTNTEVTGVTVAATYTAKDAKGNSTVDVSTAGSIATSFMKVAGYPNLALSSGSTAKWGGTRQRVAIALDVTGSMNSDGKLDAMQDAAKALIDTLAGMAKGPEDVYVSIIPFAEMVNVGAGNRSASWIDWSDWDATNGSCSNSNYKTKSTCQSYGKTWTAANRNTWKGCVTDRDQPYDTTNAAPTSSSTSFPADQAGPSGSNACPSTLLGMTALNTQTNVDIVKNKIGSLSAAGGTNQPIGMAWAWQTLRTGAPFPAPAKDPNFQYTDTIILLSDGLNTIDRWYGNGSNPSSQVDARQKLLCDNIKVKDESGKAPQIFTIQVNTDGDPESALLKYCADPGQFYPTSTTAGIAGAFVAIGTSLAKLRVAK